MLRHAARALALLSGLPIAAPAADLAAIDAYVAQKLADHLLPGVALVVVQEGKVVHHRGFGEMDAASPIVIGSLSKAVTATAVLQLVDAGRVDLDAPARSYLPEFDLADHFRAVGDPRAGGNARNVLSDPIQRHRCSLVVIG